VLLDRQVGVALIEEGVLEHAIRVGERLLDVAEAQRHGLVNVAGVAVLANARFGVGEAVLRIGERAERLVFHVDIVEGFERRQFVARDDGSDRITDETDAIHRERVLVLADGENAVRDGEVPPGQNQQHARTRKRTRCVDSRDARVGHGRSQQFAVHHPGQHHIVREARLTGDFGPRVDTSPGRSDDPHRASPVLRIVDCGLRIGCGLWIAASTASKIC
jgi:hypothetical protein